MMEFSKEQFREWLAGEEQYTTYQVRSCHDCLICRFHTAMTGNKRSYLTSADSIMFIDRDFVYHAAMNTESPLSTYAEALNRFDDFLKRKGINK